MILLDSNLNNEQFYDNTEIINKFIKFPVNIYSKNGIFKKLDSSIVGLWNNQNITNVIIEFKSNKLKNSTIRTRTIIYKHRRFVFRKNKQIHNK